MAEALKTTLDKRFIAPDPIDQSNLKPVLKGVWQGGEAYTIDRVSGKLATELTPTDAKEEKVVQSVHSILYWVDKNNPLGPIPSNPESDSQFEHWETPVRAWAEQNKYADQDKSVIPKEIDDVHTPENVFKVTVQNTNQDASYGLNENISVFVNSTGRYPLVKASLYINGDFIETVDKQPFIFRFSPKDIQNIRDVNEIRVIGTDSVYDKSETTTNLSVRLDG